MLTFTIIANIGFYLIKKYTKLELENQLNNREKNRICYQ